VTGLPTLQRADAYSEACNPYVAQFLEDFALDRTYVRGDGCWLVDAEGRRVLDGIAQYGAVPLGHTPLVVREAVRRSFAEAEPNFVQPSRLRAAGELAQALLAHAPGMDRVTFCGSGTEAVEAAIKLCRAATGHQRVISATGSFHGKTLGALSATGRGHGQATYGAPAGAFEQVAYGEVEALEVALQRGPAAAVILEPIQGEGGIVVPPEGYLRRVASLCRQHGVPLVLDEVQTGLGCTGALFAGYEQGVQPDVLVLAKALSGGVVPIGACVYRGALLHRDFAMEHSSTFAGGSVACRAGLAALQELSDPGLLHRVSVLGAYLRQELLRLARRYPTLMQGVRGRGLMLGVVLRADPQAWAGSLLLHLGGQGGLGYLVCALLLEEGVRLAPTLSDGDVLRIEPPLTNARAEARTLVAALDRVLGWLVAKGTTEALRPLLGPPQAQRAEPTTAHPHVHGPGPVQFAFLLHPLDADGLCDVDPSLHAFSDAQRQRLMTLLSRHGEPFLLGEATVGDPRGRRTRGVFVVVPHTAAQLREMSPLRAQAVVASAVGLACGAGAQVIGLGGYTSVVTQGGLLLDVPADVVLTSGSSMTALAGALALEHALHGRAEGARTVGVLGASGHVGAATVVLALERAHRLLLVLFS